MAVVLDAAAHPAGERSGLVREAIANSGARRRVALNERAEFVSLRAEAWQLGATRVLRTVGTGLTLTRTEHDVRRDAPDLVAIALSPGRSRYRARGVAQALGRNGVVVVDFSTPYVFSHAGRSGSSFTTHISHADLGVPVDVVRAAIPRLISSPLLPLVRGHLVRLSAAMGDIAEPSAVAVNLGAATTDLTRALIVSAAGDRRERDVLHETLRARIVAYVEAHLHEADLTPHRIAAAHNISLRTLYNAWGEPGGGVADWIIRQRLEHIRRELLVSRPGVSVSAVARRWGFADPTHFGRRFRAVYGAPPTEWLRHCVGDIP